ncbi:DNA polymerase III subunit alpha [Apibacter raozihei]|uniref:DNA polymerase III subunit alpha n=1 Tax=Apibacter raozihei TaxID=2500547 RepID=UPI000FE2B4D4|nr:DNA polymerase III subunit alpha [Apibacter raozihei]
MKFLVFDTETTGLPANANAPVSDSDNWPRMVQIAWQLHDENGDLVENYDFIIKPEGYDIPFNAQKIHGISTEKALAEGHDLKTVLDQFNQVLAENPILVGQNISFDIPIVGAEFYRKSLENNIAELNLIDTAQEGTSYCAIPGGPGGGFKYPKLSELYERLFGYGFDEAHNAAADVNATAQAFWELVRLRQVSAKKLFFTEEELNRFIENHPSPFKAFDIIVRQQVNEFNQKLKEKQSQVKKSIDEIDFSHFFHFHNHSVYSILTSTSKHSDLIKKTLEYKMPALGVTDFGNLMGAFAFLNEIKKVNSSIKEHNKKVEAGELNEPVKKEIIPIVGCELYISENYLQNKFTKDNPDRRYSQILLAKNHAGFKNLSKLSTFGYKVGLYAGYPRIGKELIEQYKENLIATTGGLSSEIPSLILNVGEKQAEEAFVYWHNLFGEDFYVELLRHHLDEEEHLNKVLLRFAEKYGVKVLAQNDTFYINKEEAETQDILLCIKDGEKQSTPIGRGFGKRYGLPNNEYNFKSQKEMALLFSDIPEAIENFEDFIKKFEPYQLAREVLLPKFDIPDEFKDPQDDIDGGKRGENAYLAHLTWVGAKKRYGDTLPEETRERLQFELEIIAKTGYPGYFLIVQDFTSQARKMGVAVGPGRGSAAGSAVAYCIGITNIDPIKYDLLFERFLNPDRVSLPDIDIDFDDRGRERIIQWVVDKYGENQVAQIITYGTLAGRSAIRDAGRVLELPLSDTDRLSKNLPPNLNLTKLKNRTEADLQKDFGKEEAEPVLQLKQKFKSDDLEGKVIQNAFQLEGSLRNTGVHACGVIITPEDITNLIPVSVAKDSSLLVSQFDNSVVESAGLLKMDFLGLRTLTIIGDTIEIIRKRTGQTLNPDDFPLDDETTYEIFKNGNTVGIFQYESPGMQKHLKALQPDKFEDLIAMNALYRPGPLQYIPNFINRKHGKEEITYDLPDMEEYLADTYGITVYQEQVMLLSQKLAGFSKGDADVLRKAMGKKQIDVLNKMEARFLDGAIERGHPEEKLKKIWEDWKAFAQYAFNKSHSTCYAFIAFQTAYLKAHYPAEFMAALLSNNLNNLTTLTFFMEECKNMGLEVLGPDVNESDYEFTVNEKGAIRFGMGAIKGIGENAVEAIVKERVTNGKYTNLFEFFERADLKNINKKVLENLVLAGAFDELGNSNRAQFFAEENGSSTIEKLVRYGTAYQDNKNSAQNSLFGDLGDGGFDVMKPLIPTTEEWSTMYKLGKEKEVVGIYISAHPMDNYKYEIALVKPMDISEVNENKEKYINKEIYIAGMISRFEHKDINDGRTRIAFFDVEDKTGTISLKLKKNYLDLQKYLIPNLFVLVKIMVGVIRDNGFVYINVISIEELSDIIGKHAKKLTIKINLEDLDENTLATLNKVCDENAGSKDIHFEILDKKNNLFLETASMNKRVNITKEVLDTIKDELFLDFRLN